MRTYYYDDLYSFKRLCIGTKYQFMLWPRTCYLSGKLIWFEIGVRQTAMYTGPGDPVFEHRYYNKNEFLVNRIKEVV